MGLRSFLILTALALASCGGGTPPATKSAPPATEDIAAGNTVPDEAEPPSAEPTATPAPAPAASNEASVAAPTSARFQLGKHYNRLSPTQPTSSPPDKVEVAEVFWYGCPHCYALDPAVKTWLAGKPEYVSFVRLPVVWSDVAKTHARAFYTAEALGKIGTMHDALFREIHDNHDLLDTEDKLQAFFGTLGVDAATFKAAYESAGVQTKVQRADELGRRYRVGSVPTIVVNGKYVTDVGLAGGTEQLFALIGELAASEHSGK
jgi:protein dithiol oxidoreductase (disulfide-forming)